MPLKIRARPRKVLCWDLENRPLAYWYDGETTSEITAFGWKWGHEEGVHTLLLNNNGRFVKDDGKTISQRRALEDFTGTLRSADLNYGHNIRSHDLPMLQAHLLRLEMPLLGPVLTCDTLRDLPKRKGMSFSLENLAAFYGLEGEKHSMTQAAWENANRLTRSGIDEARVRVTSDVLLQERLRNKLLELEILKAPRIWRG